MLADYISFSLVFDVIFLLVSRDDKLMAEVWSKYKIKNVRNEMPVIRFLNFLMENKND